MALPVSASLATSIGHVIMMIGITLLTLLCIKLRLTGQLLAGGKTVARKLRDRPTKLGEGPISPTQNKCNDHAKRSNPMEGETGKLGTTSLPDPLGSWDGWQESITRSQTSESKTAVSKDKGEEQTIWVSSRGTQQPVAEPCCPSSASTNDPSTAVNRWNRSNSTGRVLQAPPTPKTSAPARAFPSPVLSLPVQEDPSMFGKLRDPSLKVQSGMLLNLLKDSFLTEYELRKTFEHMSSTGEFQWFAGRSIMDFKIKGKKTVDLPPTYSIINPIVRTMVAIATHSMLKDEELAIIQLIINFFQDGGDEVKPHSHRCRQVCVSLGADRDLEVEGRRLQMGFADALPLGGEVHSVPPMKRKTGPRISLCLFYGSKAEYDYQTMSVNAQPGKFGESYWWTHPNEIREHQSKNKEPKSRRREQQSSGWEVRSGGKSASKNNGWSQSSGERWRQDNWSQQGWREHGW